MGLRAAISAVFIDLGDDAKAREQRALNEKLLADQPRGSGRVQVTLGPHAIYTVSEANLRWNREFASAHKLRIHLHLSETEREVQDCLRATGKRPVPYLDSLGFLGPDVIAAHCVHLDPDECRLLADRGVKPVHVPVSNLKLAVGGVMPYPELHKAGASVLLGTDGCCSNNNLDMFETMKFAALIQKHAANDPTCLPAADAWAMATARTADAFGLDAGRLAEGRLADLILVDPRRAALTPGYHLHSDLVYAANGSCVDTTICDGKVLMYKGKIRGEAAILAEAREAARRLTGLPLPNGL
jgi:5-methylthioadenosine/S-adenosylhomocysteine deaminase